MYKIDVIKDGQLIFLESFPDLKITTLYVSAFFPIRMCFFMGGNAIYTAAIKDGVLTISLLSENLSVLLCLFFSISTVLVMSFSISEVVTLLF